MLQYKAGVTADESSSSGHTELSDGTDEWFEVGFHLDLDRKAGFLQRHKMRLERYCIDFDQFSFIYCVK